MTRLFPPLFSSGYFQPRRASPRGGWFFVWMATLVFASRGASGGEVPATIAPADARAAWTAEWPDPNDGTPLRFTFHGDAVLVAAPGATVHVTPVPPGRRLRVVEGERAHPWTSRLSVPMPARASDATSFSRRLRLDFDHGASATLWVQAPSMATVERAGFGRLRVGMQELGIYRAPQESGARKVKDNPGAYRPPACFMRLEPEALDAWLTPGLRVGDGVVPSAESGERHTLWVPVHYGLWRAVASIRGALAARGIRPEALRVISAFRSPVYNRAVGSGRYGRHVYGDAVDFMIDADGDGATDDLTGDGRVDRRDGLWMVALLEELMAEGTIPLGGVGCYTFATSPKKVTWHYDARGHRATWGYHYNAAGKKGEFAWESRRFAEVDARERAEARARAQAEKMPYVESRRDPLPLLPPSNAAPRP